MSSNNDSLVKLSEKQAHDCLVSFDKFNKRSDGTKMIKVSDLMHCMKDMGLNVKSEWLEKMSDCIDVDGKGFVGFEEYELIVRKKIQNDDDERELKEIFRVLDKEKKGEVDVNEIRWILKELGDDMTEEDIDDMIMDVDTDGSGWVDYDEFAKLMLSE